MTTSKLVDKDGHARQGIFTGAVDIVNHEDYLLLSPFGRPASWWKRRFGFNQFTFLGALCDDVVFGCAVADIKYIATAFAYVYEPASRRLIEHSFRAPLARGAHIDRSPETGTALFRRAGVDIAMTSGASPAHRRLRAQLDAGLDIDAYFDEARPSQQPMRICTRTGATGWVFARKTAGMPVSGTLSYGGKTIDLAAVGARGHCDWSAGYMRRETFWNWGCIAGTTHDGRALGLNVACGVNETSFTENCFWVDGVLHKIDSVAFHYAPSRLMEPWRMTSYDGRLQLEFHPEGRHAENVNAVLIASNFNQLIGRYFGTLETDGGETIELNGQLGYAESHYARW